MRWPPPFSFYYYIIIVNKFLLPRELVLKKVHCRLPTEKYFAAQIADLSVAQEFVAGGVPCT